MYVSRFLSTWIDLWYNRDHRNGNAETPFCTFCTILIFLSVLEANVHVHVWRAYMYRICWYGGCIEIHNYNCTCMSMSSNTWLIFVTTIHKSPDGENNFWLLMYLMVINYFLKQLAVILWNLFNVQCLVMKQCIKWRKTWDILHSFKYYTFMKTREKIPTLSYIYVYMYILTQDFIILYKYNILLHCSLYAINYTFLLKMLFCNMILQPFHSTCSLIFPHAVIRYL